MPVKRVSTQSCRTKYKLGRPAKNIMGEVISYPVYFGRDKVADLFVVRESALEVVEALNKYWNL